MEGWADLLESLDADVDQRDRGPTTGSRTRFQGKRSTDEISSAENPSKIPVPSTRGFALDLARDLGRNATRSQLENRKVGGRSVAPRAAARGGELSSALSDRARYSVTISR